MSLKPALIAGLLLALAPALGRAAPSDAAPRLPATVSPTHYALEIEPDARGQHFTGSVRIDIDVAEATPRIVLNARELQLGAARLRDSGAAAAIALDAGAQTATLDFAAPVTAGHHVLEIDYSGRVNETVQGLFRLDYAAGKETRHALYTQLEATDARRFFPCWDEPARKATFSLTAVVPAADMAVSNMPSEHTESLEGGRKRVRFATTPRMSSYLLFFATGDFERTTRQAGKVEIGAITLRGAAARGAYALEAAAQILPYYEAYFGLAYPLPKLDLIAGPGQSQGFSAMENWGAIFCFDFAMLVDPAVSGESDRRRAYRTIAHEMAHQWFGDLVTMAWWDDIWLNEGFATWLEGRATQHFHPDWRPGLDAQGGKEAAMRTDARRGSHPVVQEVIDVERALTSFDIITYVKGRAVIAMIEDFIGADAFQAGLQRYMRDHAYGNTVSADLWHAVGSGQPLDIERIAQDFTGQPGLPLVRAERRARLLHLTPGQFVEDDSAPAAAGWHIPVRVQNGGTTWRGVVEGGGADIPLAAPEAPFLVNPGQNGYFRTVYATADRARLRDQFARMDAADQLGLLNDARVLGYAGLVPLSEFLELGQRLPADADARILRELAARLREIDTVYDGLPGQARLRGFATAVLAPLARKLGWDAQAGESANLGLLRREVLGALARFGDPAVLAAARTRFAQFLERPAALDPEQRDTVLAIVADQADVATYEKLLALARGAGDELARQKYYRLLGAACDPALADRTLALALDGSVPATLRLVLVRTVSENHPAAAFHFAVAHWDTVRPLLDPLAVAGYVPQLARTAHDEALAGEVRGFVEAHVPASARARADMVIASIRLEARVRAERLPELDRWLAARSDPGAAALP